MVSKMDTNMKNLHKNARGARNSSLHYANKSANNDLIYKKQETLKTKNSSYIIMAEIK